MKKPLSLFWILMTAGISCFAGPSTTAVSLNTVQKKFISAPVINGRDSSIVVIPFEYKQSALYHSFTLEVMDSVINILLKNPLVTVSVEGYTHIDEGSDTISYYLSLNRALFIKDYILGRGIDSSRIISVKGLGKARPLYHGVNKDGIVRNCRAEITLNYPRPPAKPVIADKDEDGIPDAEDECPDVYGEKEFKGCRNKDAVVIPFDTRQSAFNTLSYKILDSVLTVLKQNPAYNISVEGHAYPVEGSQSVCNSLSKERAEMVRDYMLSRYMAPSRIVSVKNFGYQRPLNAGKTARQVIDNSRAEVIIIHP